MLALYVGPLLLSLLWAFSTLTSPLFKLPGPWYAHLTSLVLKFYELRGERRKYIHRLHQIYGPAVRIGPNEVAFDSLESQKEIYCSGGSGFDKTEFYDLFTQYGERTMFTTLGKGDHAARKRRFADRFAMTNILRPEVIGGIQKQAAKVADYCEKAAGKAVDIYVVLHCYALDCVTHHLFAPGGLDSLNDSSDRLYMEELCLDNSLQARLLKTYLPTPLHPLLSLLSFLDRTHIPARATATSKTYVLAQTAQPSPSPHSLMAKLHSKREAMRDIEMSAECMDQMAAGIDTTGDALCYLLWHISMAGKEQKAIQEKLRAEVRGDTGKTEVALNDLPYLDAVVKESLRVFPPIPMSLPRYVPVGGRLIEGFMIPEKTVVSCQAWSLNRVEEVFKDPEVFRPERWLEGGEGERERLACFFAFAQGGRGCIGKNLATMEMKALLKEIYSRFRTTIATAEMESVDMTMDDQVISARPKDQKCFLKFETI